MKHLLLYILSAADMSRWGADGGVCDYKGIMKTLMYIFIQTYTCVTHTSQKHTKQTRWHLKDKFRLVAWHSARCKDKLRRASNY